MVAPRRRFTSSCIVAGSYDAADETMTLVYRDSAVYVYYDVPEEVWSGLLAAPSKGRYVAAEIRDAGFAYEQLE